MSDGSTSRPTKAKLYSLIALMTLLWSMNYVIAKFALREMPAILAFGIRTVVAGFIILPVYLVRGHRTLLRRDWIALFLLGLVGVVFNQMFFILGLSRTSVAHAALVIGLTPLLVLLTAWAAGQERIGLAETAGMFMALSGVGVLQFSSANTKAASFQGDALVFLAALTFAIFTVKSREARTRYDGLTLNTFAYVSGALVLLPSTIYHGASFPLAAITPAAWMSILYMAGVSSVACYLIYFHTLQYVPASRIATFSYLQPLLATLFAVPVLDERPTGSLMTGALLILAGVFIAERA